MCVDVLKLGRRTAKDFSQKAIVDYRVNGPMSHYHNHPRITDEQVAEDMARAEALANDQTLLAYVDALQVNSLQRN